MGCLFAIFAGVFPRLAVLIVWIARPERIDAAFSTFLWAAAGHHLPAVCDPDLSAVVHPRSGAERLDWFWVVLAALLDIGHWGASATQRNRDPGQTGLRRPRVRAGRLGRGRQRGRHAPTPAGDAAPALNAAPRRAGTSVAGRDSNLERQAKADCDKLLQRCCCHPLRPPFLLRQPALPRFRPSTMRPNSCPKSTSRDHRCQRVVRRSPSPDTCSAMPRVSTADHSNRG